MQSLRSLVAAVNVYLQESEQAKSQPSTLILKRVAQYITRIFTVRHATHPHLSHA